MSHTFKILYTKLLYILKAIQGPSSPLQLNHGTLFAFGVAYVKDFNNFYVYFVRFYFIPRTLVGGCSGKIAIKIGRK